MAKNFQSFGVKNYLGSYNHVDACCQMTSPEQKYFFLFYYWFILLLDKSLITWIFEVFVEVAICKPKKINFFFGSDKLLMTEIKSKQAYNHVGAWYAMTQSKLKY